MTTGDPAQRRLIHPQGDIARTMTDLPAGAAERMRAVRRAAEEKLKCDLDPLRMTMDVFGCIPAFAEFARAIFRGEAEELLAIAARAESFEAGLEALAARIVEEIMPDAGLAIARASGRAGALPQYERDMATGTLWEVDADGARRPASDPAYGEHGDWERHAPLGVKFRVRGSLYPGINAAVRAALASTLRSEKTYWTGRYALTRSNLLDLLDHIHRQLFDWDETARRIGAAGSFHLARSTLLAWRDAQIGKHVRRPVKAARAQLIADSVQRVAIELNILPA